MLLTIVSNYISKCIVKIQNTSEEFRTPARCANREFMGS